MNHLRTCFCLSTPNYIRHLSFSISQQSKSIFLLYYYNKRHIFYRIRHSMCSHRSLIYAVLLLLELLRFFSECADYIFIQYNWSYALPFKGFSPTHLSRTPVAEFHSPNGDSRWTFLILGFAADYTLLILLSTYLLYAFISAYSISLLVSIFRYLYRLESFSISQQFKELSK